MNLSQFSEKHFQASDGKNGYKRFSQGKKGGDLYVSVPIGTTVYSLKNDKLRKKAVFLKSLDKNKDQIIVAKGG